MVQVEFEIGLLENVFGLSQRQVQSKALHALCSGRNRCRSGRGLRLRGPRRQFRVVIFFQRVFHRRQQLLQSDRLFQKSQGTDFGGLYRRINRGMATHHDHRHGEQTAGGPLLEQGDTIHIRHPNVQQDQIRHLGGAGGAGLRGILSQRDRMALVIEHLPEQVTNAMFIVNNQNMCHRFSIFKQQK